MLLGWTVLPKIVVMNKINPMQSMRFYKILSFIALFGFSCDTALDSPEISSAPFVSISAPATLTAGTSTDLTAFAQDGSQTPLRSAKITLLSGSTVISTNSAIATSNKLDLKIAGSVVAAQRAGAYKLEVEAEDVAGQKATTSKEITFACTAPASCKETGKTTVIVITPPTTPANVKIGLIGSLTGWSTDILMTKIAGTDNCFCAAVTFPNGSEFKFRRSETATSNPDWNFVEKEEDCEELDNRKQSAAPDATVILTVANWRNTGTCPN